MICSYVLSGFLRCIVRCADHFAVWLIKKSLESGLNRFQGVLHAGSLARRSKIIFP